MKKIEINENNIKQTNDDGIKDPSSQNYKSNLSGKKTHELEDTEILDQEHSSQSFEKNFKEEKL